MPRVKTARYIFADKWLEENKQYKFLNSGALHCPECTGLICEDDEGYILCPNCGASWQWYVGRYISMEAVAQIIDAYALEGKKNNAIYQTDQ